ncbi:DapH/DapD/GlmU-related protein [Mucilaginibacter agri]|uniref:Acetyltransferase n=1 Tax=Mucilaginibacter agri TaxID=2695265 RepID=A0A965ZGR1_9SPHI|nr:DapH/DapD/GlmU-related protein [Mucilaginibacter agri]NCD70759.1 acetyltransferase [Mucilaginibacter agri]
MFRKYGIVGVWRLLCSLIYTKIFYRDARLIRLPFDIRNKHLIAIEEGLTTGFGCRIEAVDSPGTHTKLLRLGKNIQMNDYVHITAGNNVTIGDNVLIASRVYISDTSHGRYGPDEYNSPFDIPVARLLFFKHVIIEDNVWLGEGVCVLPGVTIGFGAIIGANAVVTKNVPAMSIAVGAPAKVIKKFDEDTGRWEKV